MQNVFLAFLNVSIEASVIICIFALIRLLLKKCPAYVRCIIWAVVALRLIVPISIESAFSLMPERITVGQAEESLAVPEYESHEAEVKPLIPIPVPESQPEAPEMFESATPDLPEYTPPAPVIPDTPEEENPAGVKEAHKKSPLGWISVAWIIGAFLMLCYIAYNLISTYIKTRSAAVEDDKIRIASVKTPFVFGFIKPRIFLPAHLSAEERFLIISHENAHISRGDHISKIFAFLVLSLHWFNPFVWLGYVLFCRDVELACDEKVIKNMSYEERQAYSFALLKCSTGRLGAAYSLLAFGEVGTKERVKKVMSYKKPAIWAVCIAIATCLVLVFCFATRPNPNQQENSTSNDVSAETSDDVTSDDVDESALSNYALHCDYDVYNSHDTLFQNGNGYLNGYDDTGLVKLTDGIIDKSTYTSGYGSTDKNAMYVVDAGYGKITYRIDLGTSYDDVGIIKLRNLYMTKPAETSNDYSSPYFSVSISTSEDDINYDMQSCTISSNVIGDVEEFTREDKKYEFLEPCKARYVKIEIRYLAKVMGLSEIEVHPKEFTNAAALDWDFTNGDTLTIRGNGGMYFDVTDAPWKPLSDTTAKVIIEEGITSICPNAFSNFNALKSVVIPNSVSKIDHNSFYSCDALESVTIPKNVKTVSTNAFARCQSLKSVKLPEGLTTIEAMAFYGCESLESAALPDSVTFIGQNTFGGCSKLKIDKLPSELETVGASAFCSYTDVVIPKNVASIGQNAFVNAKSFAVDDENPYYCAKDGVLFTKNKDVLFAYPASNDATEYKVPDSVTKVYSNAFDGARNLTAVTLPEGLKTINSYAFYECTALQSISIPDKVTSIGEFAFFGCKALTNVKLSTSLQTVKSCAFSECSSLKKIDIPDSVKEIESAAFSYCTSLTEVKLSAKITVIAGSAFGECKSLEGIVIPKGVQKIEDMAFYNSGIKSVVIPEGVTDIGSNVFGISLNDVSLPASLKNISFNSGCFDYNTVKYNGTVADWCGVKIEGNVTEWTSIDVLQRSFINCTDGKGAIMHVKSYDWEDTLQSTAAFVAYDGTVQGMVDAMKRSDIMLYPLYEGIKVNSFRIENTANASLRIAYIDLSEEFSKGFEYGARRASVINTLRHNILNNHLSLGEDDSLVITVNGKDV